MAGTILVNGESVRLPDGVGAVLRAARKVARSGRPMTVRELTRASDYGEVSVIAAISRLREMGLWEWEVAPDEPGANPHAFPREAYGSISDTLLAAAGAILGRGEPLTTRALRAELGWTAPQVSSRVHRLKRAGRWPHRLLPDGHGGQHPASRRPEVEARWAEEERVVLEAASTVADAEGRLALAELVAACGPGVDYDLVWRAQKRLRTRREWPYLARRDAPPPAPDPEEIRKVDLEREAIDREILARMIDARHQVDDPVEHGWLTMPWSGPVVPSPGPSLRRVCRVYFREWRAIRASAGGAP